MITLNNKTILVTGASSGIGKATAILLSQLGAKVLLAGRDETKLASVIHSMEQSELHHSFSVDLASSDGITQLLNNIIGITSSIDGVVHCAGASIIEPLRFLNTESVDRLINLNLKSTIYLLSGMRKKKLFNKNASVVLLSSISGLIGFPGISAYSATKGAIIALTKSLAAELSQSDSIRVNCVAPGIVETDMTKEQFKHASKEEMQLLEKKYPLGFGQPEEIANSIAFLLSEKSRWITGSCLVIDGGYSLSTG